jgi:small-conductance mechanosensitive channel
MVSIPRCSFALHWRPLRRIRTASALASACLSLILTTIAAAQLSSPLTRPSPSSPAVTITDESTDTKTLESKLAEARANLAADEAAGETALANAPAGISAQDFTVRHAMLRRLVRQFEQQLSNAVELQAAKQRDQDAAREAKSWTRFADPPPYSILLTDQLRDEIDVEQLKSTSAQTAITTIDALVAENQAALRQSEENIRRLNEQLERKPYQSDARLKWQRDIERLQSQLSTAALGVLSSERQIREQNQDESRLRLELLQRQLAFATAGGVAFAQADFDKVYDRVEAERDDFERELSEAESHVAPALEAVESARKQQAAIEADPEKSTADRTRADEALATRQAQFESAQAAVRTVRFLLEAASVERTIWRLRFNSFNSQDRKLLEESQQRLAAYRRRLDLWRTLHQQQADISPGRIDLLESQLRRLPPNSDLLPLRQQRLAALRDSDQSLQRLATRMDRLQRLTQRWDDELKTGEEHLPFLSRVANLFTGVGAFFYRLWTFELFTAEDTITVEGQKITGTRSITLGKIILALLFLILAIWVTGLIARLGQRLMVKYLKLEPRQATLVRRWLRAFLVVCLFIFGLAWIRIPLTVFAFAGGALAIGLGFGLQNLLRNFVSGVLLLFERPVRVGDMVEVAGQRGTISVVGLRASVLQLFDGTEIIIPNSTLLETNLTNCTYSSRHVRFPITIGVAYGSDPRKVSDILADSAKRHGLIEEDPKPQVLFTGFGADGMIFELRFWVDVSKTDSGQVSSDLRMIIASALTDSGIVISFPQRDVHLSAATPIPVSVVASPQSPTQESLATVDQ